jgi:ElaA protein
MQMVWRCKSFEHLSVCELYDMLQLRSAVFVVEQNCAFLDPDHRDQQSMHLMGFADNVLMAYARIMPPGLAYPGLPSIGRVVTAQVGRGHGLGRLLMQKAIAECYRHYGELDIKIGAQLYLAQFYGSLGFVQNGAGYLEDGIEHIPMLKTK